MVVEGRGDREWLICYEVSDDGMSVKGRRLGRKTRCPANHGGKWIKKTCAGDHVYGLSRCTWCLPCLCEVGAWEAIQDRTPNFRERFQNERRLELMSIQLFALRFDELLLLCDFSQCISILIYCFCLWGACMYLGPCQYCYFC